MAEKIMVKVNTNMSGYPAPGETIEVQHTQQVKGLLRENHLTRIWDTDDQPAGDDSADTPAAGDEAATDPTPASGPAAKTTATKPRR